LLVGMAILAAVEALAPLHSRGPWNRAHLRANLALTAITFATNLLWNAGILFLLAWLEANGFSLLHWLSIAPLSATLLAIAAFDLAFSARLLAQDSRPVARPLHPPLRPRARRNHDRPAAPHRGSAALCSARGNGGRNRAEPRRVRDLPQRLRGPCPVSAHELPGPPLARSDPRPPDAGGAEAKWSALSGS